MVEIFDSPSGKGMCAACAEDIGPCEGPPCVNSRVALTLRQQAHFGGRDYLFLDHVSGEVARAREKFPSSNLVLAALTEELGELAQAMLKVRAGKEPPERVWEEAVQVAAMALRVAVEGDPSFNAVEYREP
jgi:hypothetical protein